MGWTAARGKDLASSLEAQALQIRQLASLEVEPTKGHECSCDQAISAAVQRERIAFGADSVVFGSDSRIDDPSTESVGNGMVAAIRRRVAPVRCQSAYGADSAVLGSGSRTCDASAESVASGMVAAIRRRVAPVRCQSA
nr:hypothetical protein [Xanthomonas sp. WHRI 8812E]MEA9634798.1 hypothetical protein [Xanthomonas sp. WHRI 8812E]